MDIDTTPTSDIVITDEVVVVEDYTNNSFGKEITKTLLISAATTAGMVGGFVVFGFAVQKIEQFKTRRASKKNVVEGEVVETTETPKTEK